MTNGRRLLSLVLQAMVVSLAVLFPGRASSQVVWQDLVFTGGLSGEGYRGNLATVTAPAVDSTESAAAVVGEFGLRGGLLLLNRPERTLELHLDGGLRQFSATGFKLRDYAPREVVGRADLTLREALPSLGELWLESGFASRAVDDRPPAPLYIEPGFKRVDGRVRLQLLPRRGAYIDAQLFGEVADYSTTPLTPQMDLLDRKLVGVEAGVTWGPSWTLRAHAGFGLAVYDNQATFDPGDPHRRDRTMSLGATWTKRSTYFIQLGMDGTFNRSNSSRPEYDAISVRAVASAPLSHNLSLTFFANLTDKSYLTETDFARLVPGEEADNASTIYLELARPLMVNLDGAVRFGWNRAETDIGDSYFERYGATFLLRYRPWEN
jgi:hypothetical protein